MTNKEINEDILKLCYIPIEDDFSNIEESKGTYLPVFLNYFKHTDSRIRDGQYRLQGRLDIGYLSFMRYLPEGDYEFSPKEPEHLIVWSIRLDIIEQPKLENCEVCGFFVDPKDGTCLRSDCENY